jgi:GNAT superfamily N-acetyltransferase
VKTLKGRVRRLASKAFGLLRAGEWRLVLDGLRHWLYSDFYAYELCRDLTVPIDVPKPAIVRTIRSIERSDVHAFTEIDPTREQIGEVWRRLLASDIQTCYVAVTKEGAPCNMQYLILPSENDKVQGVLGFLPRLAEDEALLEAGFTLEEYRGQGIMPFVMEDLAQKARKEGARRLLTFVSTQNVPALKGCRRAGFVPNKLIHRRFRLFKRRKTYTPLPKGTRYAFEDGGGASTPEDRRPKRSESSR